MKKNESKYKRIVNHVIDGINEGKYKKGDWIPSINEFGKDYKLSRDTVVAGLRELKTRGIIGATPGVGYFIASARKPSKKNIFLLFNELNEFKEDLYNSFMETIDKGDTVDLYFHNYNRKVFETLINDAIGKYTTYVIMPGKFAGLDKLLQTIPGQVLLLDHYHPELRGKYASVAQNFEKDTYEALNFGFPHIEKYHHIYMVQGQEKEPYERYTGLEKFCKKHHFEHKLLDTIGNDPIREGDLFMLVNDRDLVKLLQQAEKQKLVPGKDFGIISYNDTPLKEILAGGITTLSTDFKKMGQTMAGLLNKNDIETIGNPWELTIRKSL